MARKKAPVETPEVDDSQELVAHETYDHIFYMEDDPDTLLNEDGIPVKVDDVGEPIYDDETGLPKVRKARKAKTEEKSAPAKPRKVRITPNTRQQARLPLPGFMPYSRVMLDTGDFVRLMSWGRLQVRQLEVVPLDEAVEFVQKRDKLYRAEFQEFVQKHLELGQSYPITDFRLVRALLSDESYAWAITFPETLAGKSTHGIPLQKILKALAPAKSSAKKPSPAKKTPAKKSKKKK